VGKDDSTPHEAATARKAPLARFDDLRNGTALVFDPPPDPSQILVASQSDEVVPVLGAVEAATAAGAWAVGFVAYEAACGLDPSLQTRTARSDEAFRELPLAWFAILSQPRADEAVRARSGSDRPYTVTAWEADWDRPGYEEKVASIREHIGAGDTYQCNLTVRLRSRAGGDLYGLYEDLALAQRGAHCAYIDAGRFVVASASPELFFDWRGDRITTRPMKGTAPRGRFPAEDRARVEALAGSSKDRAENLMIVDLLRNDLGKLARWGSVEVPALFEIEQYETVFQLTSTVTARPRPATTLVDVFRALFPCGSVTGAPKRRTMDLIAEVEKSCRGVYCGAVGVVAPPGTTSAGAPFRARFNVAIRTVVVDRCTGDAVYGTGGGITWDSTPSSEHAELMDKAAILDIVGEEFSLIETMGFRPLEGVRNLAAHLARVEASAAYFGFAFDPARVKRALHDALAGIEVTRRVRLAVARDGEPVVELAPMPSPSVGPVALAVDREPVDSAEVRLFHKTTRRSIYEVRAARHREADDVVLVNESGEVTETTIANLALQLAGQWWTPPLEAGCLPGVERARLIEAGELTERSLTVEDLYLASGIALVSSLRGWRAARLLP